MGTVAHGDIMTEADDLQDVITSPLHLTTKIHQWKAAGFHVLSPAIKFTAFAPNFGCSIGALIISTDPALGECYHDKALMGEDERAIGRVGLDKIAQLAGISWLSSSSRTDSRVIQRLWEYRADGAYVSYDGTPQIISGTAEVDLRDGADQIGGWTPEGWKALMERNATTKDKVWSIGGWSDKRVLQARRFGLRLAESKAKNAAVRTLGLKAKYTVAELERPFIVLRFQYLPDMNDEGVRHLVAAAHLRGVSALYAGAARQALPESTGGDNVIDMATVRRPEPVAAVPPTGASVSSFPVTPKPAEQPAEPLRTAPAQTEATSSPATPAPATSTVSQPPVSSPGVVGVAGHLIAQVTRETKAYGPNHTKKGQTFTKWHVIDAEGVEHVTIRQKLGEAAEQAWKQQTPVMLVSAPNNFREQELSEVRTLAAPSAAPVVPSEIRL